MRVIVAIVGVLIVSGCTPADTDTESISAPAGEQPVSDLSAPLEQRAAAPPTDLPENSQELPVLRPVDVDPAVRQVLNHYLSSTDDATRSGGVEVTALDQVVTPEWLPIEQRGLREYQQRGIRTIGTTRFDHLTVQSARWTAESTVEVAVFACMDARSVWVIGTESDEPPGDLVDWLERGSPPNEPTEQQVAQWEDYAASVQAQVGASEPVLLWLVGQDTTDLRIDATETWRGYHPCDTRDESE